MTKHVWGIAESPCFPLTDFRTQTSILFCVTLILRLPPQSSVTDMLGTRPGGHPQVAVHGLPPGQHGLDGPPLPGVRRRGPAPPPLPFALLSPHILISPPTIIPLPTQATYFSPSGLGGGGELAGGAGSPFFPCLPFRLYWLTHLLPLKISLSCFILTFSPLLLHLFA